MRVSQIPVRVEPAPRCIHGTGLGAVQMCNGDWLCSMHYRELRAKIEHIGAEHPVYERPWRSQLRRDLQQARGIK